MCVHDVFLVCNYGILPAWALLIVAPQNVWTRRLVHSMLIPLLLATVYVWAIATGPPNEPGAGFATLEGVMLLFTSPWLALAGWVHYLIFDLFIGAWEVRDAERHGIRHLFVVPCLFFTLMAGPVGLAMYLGLRVVMRRDALLAETPARVTALTP